MTCPPSPKLTTIVYACAQTKIKCLKHLKSSFPKPGHSSFWNRVRWTEWVLEKYFSQSTEHDSKKWNDRVLEFTYSFGDLTVFSAHSQWSIWLFSELGSLQFLTCATCYTGKSEYASRQLSCRDARHFGWKTGRPAKITTGTWQP